MSKNDLKLRHKFVWKVPRKLPVNFWEEGVGFYFDGASFSHKINPFDQAGAPRFIRRRKPGRGFNFGFTEKGSHEEIGGNIVYFNAAIAYAMGITSAERYHVIIDAENFSFFVREYFASMLLGANSRRKLFLGDYDPSQNLESQKKSRSEPHRKHISYFEAKVVSKCFGSTDNLRRFWYLFRKSQD